MLQVDGFPTARMLFTNSHVHALDYCPVALFIAVVLRLAVSTKDPHPDNEMSNNGGGAGQDPQRRSGR